MNRSARDWLPDSAYSSPTLADAVVAAVGKWAERWFGARAPLLQGVPLAGAERRLAPGKRWHCLAPGVWIEWSEQTRLDFAACALDRAVRERATGREDKQLLLLLAARMAHELGTVLARLLEVVPALDRDPSEGSAPPRGLLATWGGGQGRAQLELLIAHDALARLRRNLCAKARHPTRAPVKLASVIGGNRFAVEAVLGSVQISALDLKEIAVGDVVVIDRDDADLVELRRPANDRILASAQLVREGGNLLLKTRTN